MSSFHDGELMCVLWFINIMLLGYAQALGMVCCVGK